MASQKVQGLNIKLSADTTAIGKALSDVNKTLSSTQKELSQVDNLLKFDPKNTTLLAQKQQLLSDAINQTRQKLEQLNKVKELADKDSNVDKNSKEYRELERQIASTTQKLNNFQKQNSELNSGLEETDKKLKDTGEEASRFGDVLKANLTSEVIIGGLKAVANVISDIGKAMASVVTDSANYADEVNTIAKQYNLSTKEIQQYQKASQLIDVEFSTIAKSMSKLTKQMTSTSKETTNAFKTLGVSVKDSNGELRDSNDVFNEVIEALGKIENETQQDSLALQIFGKSSAELGSLINGGAEQLKEFNKYLEENNLLLSQDELDSLNSVQDGFDTLQATIDGIKLKIASELAPVITPLLEELQQFIIDHKDDVVQLVKNVVEWLTGEQGQQMFNDIKDMVKNVGDFLLDLPNLRKELELLAIPLKVVADLVEAIVKAVKWIKENSEYLNEARQYNIENYGTPSIAPPMSIIHSGGFGALQSGGYNITLNASFVANGNLDESQARRFASLMAQQINEELGNQL